MNKEIWVCAYTELDDKGSAEAFSTKEAAQKFMEEFLNHAEAKWRYQPYRSAENGGEYVNIESDEPYGFIMRCIIDRPYNEFKKEYMTR